MGADRTVTLRERIGSADAYEVLTCELSFGRHHAGKTPWHFDSSTLPARVGHTLLPADIDPLAIELLSDPRLLIALGTYAPTAGWHCVPEP